jgi:CRP-like cAMP-binding protein
VSILRNAPREATVKATKPTKLLAMERDTFRDLVAQSLGTTQEFDKVIQARLGAHGGGA